MRTPPGLIPAGPAVSRLDAALETLRAAGYRRTPARTAVLRVLLDAPCHLSIRAIAEQLGDRAHSGYSTTWRSVAALTEAGLVHAVHAPTGVVYGLADRPHHHAVCESCGIVRELPAARLASAVSTIEQLSGYILDATALTATGRCEDCSRTAPHPAA